MLRTVTPTGVERHLGADEIVVSKTDLKGTITYCNDVFMRLAGYSERELLGAPHSLIRHPDMPRCVFKLLWDTLAEGNEIFAYVVNLAKDGAHYWVFAHVTPSRTEDGTIVGYHSNRRAPNRRVVDEVITPLYKALLEEEAKHGNRKEGMAASTAMLLDICRQKGMPYEQLVHVL
ncbi:MAG: chemotaxis protein [Hyphomicrobiales bacterium]|nr:MAG: chemotaxis protein [Hyphomicrobiales bacterium]